MMTCLTCWIPSSPSKEKANITKKSKIPLNYFFKKSEFSFKYLVLDLLLGRIRRLLLLSGLLLRCCCCPRGRGVAALLGGAGPVAAKLLECKKKNECRFFGKFNSGAGVKI